jgi:hypothetical protein
MCVLACTRGCAHVTRVCACHAGVCMSRGCAHVTRVCACHAGVCMSRGCAHVTRVCACHAGVRMSRGCAHVTRVCACHAGLRMYFKLSCKYLQAHACFYVLTCPFKQTRTHICTHTYIHKHARDPSQTDGHPMYPKLLYTSLIMSRVCSHVSCTCMCMCVECSNHAHVASLYARTKMS